MDSVSKWNNHNEDGLKKGHVVAAVLSRAQLYLGLHLPSLVSCQQNVNLAENRLFPGEYGRVEEGGHAAVPCPGEEPAVLLDEKKRHSTTLRIFFSYSLF